MSDWLQRQIELAQKRLEGIEPERLEIIRRKYERTPFAESPANPAASVQSPITQADAAGNASGGVDG